MLVVKKWLTRFTVACFFLAGGIEYSVILPTCWDYMDIYGADKWLYGLAICAMSISNMIVGPIMGAIYDRTHCTKAIVLFLNLFEMGGNFMYFSATSKYMILASRFIAGVGWSAGAVIYGDLARTSLKKERTAIYSVAMSLKQTGILIGPGLNIIFRSFDFNLGAYKVDKYTFPGILFILLFFQLPPRGEEEDKIDREERQRAIQTKPHHTVQGDMNTPGSYRRQLSPERATRAPSTGSTTENTRLIQSNNDMFSSNNTTNEKSKINKNYNMNYGTFSEWKNLPLVCRKIAKIALMIKCLIYEETVVLLSTLYFSLFAAFVLETGLVPTAEALLNWTDLDTSIYFTIQAIINIVVLLLVLLLSKKSKLPDIYYILFGVILELVALSWLMGFFGGGYTISDNSAFNTFTYSFGLCLVIISLPFSWVVSNALYSKLLPMRIQGFGQGVRQSTESLSAILGGLWGGAVFDIPYSYYFLYGTPTGLLLLTLLMLLFSARRLKNAAKVVQGTNVVPSSTNSTQNI